MNTRSDERGATGRRDAHLAAPAGARRRIGFWTCTALVVGNIIGIGIFLLPASLAPYGFNGLIGWAIVLTGSLVLAGAFARLARALPAADGPFDYIRVTLGELVAYLALWGYWVSVWLTNTALATGVVGYLDAAIGPADAVPPALLALALLWLMVGVNLLGVRAGGGVQLVTTVLKLVPMAAVMVLGGWLLFSAPGAYVAHLPSTPIAPGAIAATVTLTLFAMMGIESATMPAADVENPGRTIPRATLTGAVLAVVVYVFVCTIPLLLVPQHELADASAPFALLMDRFVSAGAGRWIALFVMVSGIGALNGWILMGGELTRTLAVRGTLPRVLGRNNRFGAPVNALIATGVCSSITIWMSYSHSLVAAFTFLVQIVTATVLPFYICCAIALGVLWRRRQPGCASRGALAMSIVATVCLIFALAGTGGRAMLWTVVLLAAGLPLYAYTRWRNHAATSAAWRSP